MEAVWWWAPRPPRMLDAIKPMRTQRRKMITVAAAVAGYYALAACVWLLEVRTQLRWLQEIVNLVAVLYMIGCLYWLNRFYKKADHRKRGRRALGFLLVFVLAISGATYLLRLAYAVLGR